jgi:5-methyltetrahydrofolate--homocysteine methyltransferase
MDEVGERYSSGKIFVPQMLRSAKTMHSCMDVLKPHLREGDVTSKGKVVIGTVKADLHDIGKNLVAMMLEGAGFTVVDMGVDVSPEKFVQSIQEESAGILGMSALLSTTMPSMKATLEALEKAGIRDQVKVLVGGAPVTDKFARQIKADAYAPDAGTAVATAKKLMDL